MEKKIAKLIDNWKEVIFIIGGFGLSFEWTLVGFIFYPGLVVLVIFKIYKNVKQRFEFQMPRIPRWINSKTIIYSVTALCVISLTINYFSVIKNSVKDLLESDEPTHIEPTIIEKDTITPVVYKRKLKNWNSIINHDELCNASPLEIYDLRGISDFEARAFLSIQRHLSHEQKLQRSNRKPQSSYLYSYSSGYREYWNEKRNEYYKTLGSEDSYQNTAGQYDYYRNKWLDDKILRNLKSWDKSNFKQYGFDPECPRIILFHEYDVPQRKNVNYSLRYRTYKRFEVHIYWFKDKELFKGLDSLDFAIE